MNKNQEPATPNLAPVTVTLASLEPAARIAMNSLPEHLKSLPMCVLQEAWLAFFRQLAVEFIANPDFLRRAASAAWMDPEDSPWKRAQLAGDNVIWDAIEAGSDLDRAKAA